MKTRVGFILLLAIAFSLVTAGMVFAHGKTTAGDYALEIGFHNEPVVQGVPNALDLFVTNAKTGDKIKGLEDTLQAEIIFGSSKKTLKLEPQEDLEGAYSAYIIPSQVGDYTWRIFGKINDTPVDVSMTSSPDTFNSAETKSTYSFPDSEASLAEVKSMSATALYVGIAAGLVGLVGLIVALIAAASGRRK